MLHSVVDHRHSLRCWQSDIVAIILSDMHSLRSRVRQHFLVHTSFTSMPSEFKLNSFTLDFSFIFTKLVDHWCNSKRIRFLSSSFCYLGYVFLLRSINSWPSGPSDRIKLSMVWLFVHLSLRYSRWPFHYFQQTSYLLPRSYQ